MNDDLTFYNSLPLIKQFRDISKKENYHDVPQDWFIVMTDVINSTIAIEQGRYKDVNIAGALAAIALGNLYKNLEHPFLFGGDGITFLIPGSLAKQVKSVLADTRLHVKELFDLELRVGMIPVAEIYKQGKKLTLGKFAVSDRYNQAILMGSGFEAAESMLKSKSKEWLIQDNEPVTEKADFTGFTCRWRDIPSPLGETISLIIQFNSGDEQKNMQQTLELIEKSIGEPEQYHPLNEENLQQANTQAQLGKEAIVQTKKKSGLRFSLYLLRIKFELIVIHLAIKFKLPLKAQTYKLKNIKKYNIVSSDFRKYDGALKMVVSTSTEKRQQLIEKLEALKKTIDLKYGYHVSDRALLTCILHTGSEKEVHFVDAADGGYALAAKMLKAQKS